METMKGNALTLRPFLELVDLRLRYSELLCTRPPARSPKVMAYMIRRRWWILPCANYAMRWGFTASSRDASGKKPALALHPVKESAIIRDCSRKQQPEEPDERYSAQPFPLGR
jgi:hypothetical protein